MTGRKGGGVRILACTEGGEKKAERERRSWDGIGSRKRWKKVREKKDAAGNFNGSRIGDQNIRRNSEN